MFKNIFFSSYIQKYFQFHINIKKKKNFQILVNKKIFYSIQENNEITNNYIDDISNNILFFNNNLKFSVNSKDILFLKEPKEFYHQLQVNIK